MRLLSLIALALSAAPALAQDLQRGAELYARHCATCHGSDAQGAGPLAPALIVQPTDLTRLAAGEGGVFPVVRVVMRIDGREPLVSHGSPMPVFGPFFDGREAVVQAETGQPILTSEPVADLLTWLASVQAE